MRKTRAFAVVVAAGLGGLVGGAAFFAVSSLDNRGVATDDVRPAWTEVEWPFPIDQWGVGKAFNCKPAHCGVALTIYVRAKIGFCNCKTGVADDEELERVGDNELVGGRTSALASGRPIAVAWMKGRSRIYLVSTPFALPKSMIAIAVNDRCDAIVATALLDNDRPLQLEPAVLDFLGSETILRWAGVTLGL